MGTKRKKQKSSRFTRGDVLRITPSRADKSIADAKDRSSKSTRAPKKCERGLVKDNELDMATKILQTQSMEERQVEPMLTSSEHVVVKGDSDGFKFIGFCVEISSNNENNLPNTGALYGVLKFWYPKFGYFFVHLLDDTEHNGPEVSTDGLGVVIPPSSANIILGSTKDIGSPRLSQYANERGWVSPKSNSVRVISLTSLWTARGKQTSSSRGIDVEKLLQNADAFCKRCEMTIQTEHPLEDVMTCYVCGGQYHRKCLDVLEQKSFMKSLSENILCKEAKAHRAYVTKRVHQDKLLGEYLKQNKASRLLNEKRYNKRKAVKRERDIRGGGARHNKKRRGLTKSALSRTNSVLNENSLTNRAASHCQSTGTVYTTSDSDTSSTLSYLSYEKELLSEHFLLPKSCNLVPQVTLSDRRLPLTKKEEEEDEDEPEKSEKQKNGKPTEDYNMIATLALHGKDDDEKKDSKNTHLSANYSPWHCPSCCVCVYCNESLRCTPPINPHSRRSLWRLCDKTRSPRKITPYVVCYLCGLRAHGACCFPEVPILHPNARWTCDRCAVCDICGYKDAYWIDYSSWDPCFLYCSRCYGSLQNGRHCTECRQSWEQLVTPASSLLCCNICKFSTHTYCDKTYSAPPSDTLGCDSKANYVCRVCRDGTVQERCLRLIKRFMLLDKKKDFCFPVPLSCASYWRVVKQPTNFSEMKAKAHCNVYTVPQDFLLDLLLIFHNAKMAYMPNTPIYRHANNLEKKMTRFAFNLLGLNGISKKILVELHDRVVYLASQESSPNILLSNIQDCYDFEFVYLSKEPFSSEWKLRTRFYPSPSLKCCSSLSHHSTRSVPPVGAVMSDPLMKHHAPVIFTAHNICSDNSPYRTRCRIRSDTDQSVTVPLWYLKERKLNPQFISTLSVTSSSVSDPAFNSVDTSLNDYISTLHLLHAALVEKKSLTTIVDFKIETVSELLAAALDVLTSICIYCCVSRYLTNDLCLLDFSSYAVRSFQPRVQTCFYCSRCSVCHDFGGVFHSSSYPIPVYPSPSQMTAWLSPTFLFSLSPKETNSVLQGVHQCYDVLSQSLLMFDSCHRGCAVVRRKRHFFFQSCALCHRMSHLTCEKVVPSPVVLNSPTLDTIPVKNIRQESTHLEASPIICASRPMLRDTSTSEYSRSVKYVLAPSNANSHDEFESYNEPSNGTPSTRGTVPQATPSQTNEQITLEYNTKERSTSVTYNDERSHTENENLGLNDLCSRVPPNPASNTLIVLDPTSQALYFMWRKTHTPTLQHTHRYVGLSDNKFPLNLVQFFVHALKLALEYETPDSVKSLWVQRLTIALMNPLCRNPFMLKYLCDSMNVFFPLHDAHLPTLPHLSADHERLYHIFSEVSQKSLRDSVTQPSIWISISGFKCLLAHGLSMLACVVEDNQKWVSFCTGCVLKFTKPDNISSSSTSFLSNLHRIALRETQRLTAQSTAPLQETTSDALSSNASEATILEETADAGVLLLCQVCSRTTPAWNYPDLRDIKSCMLNVPFVCEKCKAEYPTKHVSFPSVNLTSTLAQTIFTLMQDLRSRFLQTQRIYRLLCTLFGSLCRSAQRTFYTSHVTAFMDSPTFAPYRYAFLQDTNNFAVTREDSSEAVSRHSHCARDPYSFPLLHHWWDSHPGRPRKPNDDHTHTTLTLLCLKYLPYIQQGGVKVKDSTSVPVKIIGDPFPFFWTPRCLEDPQFFQCFVSFICYPRVPCKKEYLSLFIEISLLIGLYYRFLHWVEASYYSKEPRHQLLNHLRLAHDAFFCLPRPVVKYLKHLRELCTTVDSQYNFVFFKKISEQRSLQCAECLIDSDLTSPRPVSQNKCVLCSSAGATALLGPLIRWKQNDNPLLDISSFVHRECILWSLDSLCKSRPAMGQPLQPNTTMPSSVDDNGWKRQKKGNSVLLTKDLLTFQCEPLVQLMFIPSYVVSFLFRISVDSFCGICNKSNATVACVVCKRYVYHLSCFFEALHRPRENHPCYADLVTRTIECCPRCNELNPGALRAKIGRRLYGDCFLGLLGYLCQSVISFANDLHGPMHPDESVRRDIKSTGILVNPSWRVDPWLKRRYHTIAEFLEPITSCLPCFSYEATPCPRVLPSLFDPSTLNIVNPGNLCFSSVLHMTSTSPIPYGFHSIRVFWDSYKLRTALHDPGIPCGKNLLANYHCRVTLDPSSLSVVYVLQQDTADNEKEDSLLHMPRRFSGETLVLCVMAFYRNLIPLLTLFLTRRNIHCDDLQRYFPSPADFFGLEHPDVIMSHVFQRSILDSYTILNGGSVCKCPCDQIPSLSVDFRRFNRPYRSRLWMAIYPPRSVHSCELAKRRDSLVHYNESHTLNAKEWKDMNSNRGMYIFKADSTFLVQHTDGEQCMMKALDTQEAKERCTTVPKGSSKESLTDGEDTIQDAPQPRSCASRSSNSMLTDGLKDKLTSLRSGRLGLSRKKLETIPHSLQYRSFDAIMARDNYVTARSSGIHGMGLFAVSGIPKGQPVIEYIGHVIRNVVADQREKLYQKHGLKDSFCYMFRLNAYYVVDGTTAGNLARFINHCCQPNCVCRIITDDVGDQHIVIFASRPIQPGEEITYDYKFNVEEESLRLLCLCGAPGCIGRMN